MKLLLVLFSLALIAGRALWWFLGVPIVTPSIPGSFEAFAHLFVGLLIGLSFLPDRRWFCLKWLSAISAVEALFFFVFR